MPKVTTERICLDGAVKGELSFKYDIQVNADGTFSEKLPADIVEKLKNAGISLGFNKQRRDGYFSDNTIDGLKSQVTAICKEYISRELVRETIVIAYQIRTTAAFCYTQDGDIVPNGGWVKGERVKWEQGTESHYASYPHPFSVSVYANPMIKREYVYRSGKEYVNYTNLSDNSLSEFTKEPFVVTGSLYWLSELTVQDKISGKSLIYVDYTPEIADFFVMVIKNMCKLSEALKNFVNPETLELEASRGFKELSNSIK